MIQVTRQFAKGMKRIVATDMAARSVHTKSDLLKMMGLTFDAQSHTPAQGSPKIPDTKRPSTPSTPLEFFNMLEKAGMKPDKTAYTQLLSAYSAQGDVENALLVFRKLKDQEIPDNQDYHTAIVACVNGRDQKAATRVLREMKKDGITPGVETCNVVLSGYVAEGNVAEATKLFSKMKKANTRTYNLLMSICFNGEQPEKAMAYWNQIEKVGLKPDLESYNTWLSRGSSPQIIDLSGILGTRITRTP